VRPTIVVGSLVSLGVAALILATHYEWAPDEPVQALKPKTQTAPTVPAVTAAAQVEFSAPRLALHGIVQTGTARLALLKSLDRAEKPTAEFAVGDKVEDGWVLERIDADRVLISKGASNLTLLLDSTRSSASDPQTTALASMNASSGVRQPEVRPMMVPDDQARENNRRFLEGLASMRARQGSMAAPN
jgi:hypothetical protein